MNLRDHRFPETIYGEFIYLSKIKFEDAPFIHDLRSSKAARYLNQPEGYSIEMQLKWQALRTDSEANYIIYNRLGERVGMVSIYDCDWQNGVSNVGRLLLKEEYVNGGTAFGLETLKICYKYVFEVMGFRKISGTINSKNEKVVKLQTYLGMIQEGCFKHHVLSDYEYIDLYFFSLMKSGFSEYEAKIDLLLNKFRL